MFSKVFLFYFLLLVLIVGELSAADMDDNPNENIITEDDLIGFLPLDVANEEAVRETAPMTLRGQFHNDSSSENSTIMPDVSSNTSSPNNKTSPINNTTKIFSAPVSQADDNDNDENKLCVPLANCFSDSDCGTSARGNKIGGFCSGWVVGTCNCDVCFTGVRCKTDSDCGNLRHACNTQTGFCNCIKAYKINGFKTFVDALINFCNKKQCDGLNTDGCFGLPCRRGRCICPIH